MSRGKRLRLEVAMEGTISRGQMYKRLRECLTGVGSSPLVLHSGLILFCIFVWLSKIKDIDLHIAWGGFSPIAYVYKSFYPENFLKDFPSGYELYDKSVFMHVYKIAYGYFGIIPETMIPIVIAIEYIIFSWAVYSLSRALLPRAPLIASILTIVLAIAGYGRDMDIARFGQPFFVGQYYNIADALRIFSIVQVLKGNIIIAALLLAAAVSSHPIIGLIGVVFVLSMVVIRPREYPTKPTIIGIVLFFVISGSWLFSAMKNAVIFGGAIPSQEWISLTKLNTVHWYPIESGLFTANPIERFVPFLSFLLLFLFYATRPPISQYINRKIIAGLVAMMILTVTGIIFSVFPIPVLVKIALHRASALFIMVGLIYIVTGLWNDIEYKPLLRRVAALLILISPFVFHPGYPLFFAISLTAPAWLSILRRKSSSKSDWLTTLLALGIVILLLIYVVFNLAGPFSSDAYTLGQSFSRLFSSYGVVILLPLLLLNKWTSRPFVYGIVIVIFMWLAVLWVKDESNRIMDSRARIMAESYKQAQLWAKDNTPKESLFMVDPTIYYGWRDYSQRSSFGNLREWLYTSWAYDSNANFYREGLKRFHEFSIRLDDYLAEKPPIVGFSKLSPKIGEKYYSESDEWRMNLARKYGIDYFIMIKRYMTKPTMLQVAYENENFLVLKAKF